MKTLFPPQWKQLFIAVVILTSLVVVPAAAHAQDDVAAGAATVSVSALNVRMGPGTGYKKLGLANAGDELVVKGKFGACAWLYVETPGGILGWVSGSVRYVNLKTACADLPPVDPATAEVVAPTPAATSAAATPTTTPEVAPKATANAVEPTATPGPQVVFYGTVVPEGKGCIAWGNYVGPDILVTATHQKTREIIETTLPNNQVTVVCYEHGPWTMTVSAISNRFRDLNFEIEINAGDTLDWPFIRS